jgi:hypothetical protein
MCVETRQALSLFLQPSLSLHLQPCFYIYNLPCLCIYSPVSTSTTFLVSTTHHPIYVSLPPNVSIQRQRQGRPCLYGINLLKNSQATIPRQTEILRECFVPAWGISRATSASSIASSLTPWTSLPKTRQYFFPS